MTAIIWMALLAAALPAGEAQGAAALDLVAPLHLNVFGIYSDGGTVPFEIVDARGVSISGCFDGRMRGIGRDLVIDTRPAHVYIGATHPTKPGARPLPLWGDEERALLVLLDAALENDLSAEDRSLLSSASYPIDWSDDRRASLGFVLRCVESRKRMLRCIDEGLAACEDCLRSQNAAESPFVLESIGMDDSTLSYVARIRDASGKRFEIVVPADTTGPDFPPSQLRDRFTFKYPLGSSGDRCVLTTLSLASAGAPISLQPALLGVVRARIRHTRSTDADPQPPSSH